MRQSPRAKQLRPLFDSLDQRIAPSSFAAAPTSGTAETSTATPDGTTSIKLPPNGGGASGPSTPR